MRARHLFLVCLTPILMSGIFLYNPHPVTHQHHITNKKVVSWASSTTSSTTTTSTSTTTTTTTTSTTVPFHFVPPPPVHDPVTASGIVEDYLGPFLDCVRHAESGNNYTWGYPTGTGDGGGAYQFEEHTWDHAVTLPGNLGGAWGSATPQQQDAAALALYRSDGTEPWSGDGCA